jgi:hypothetical protein
MQATVPIHFFIYYLLQWYCWRCVLFC